VPSVTIGKVAGVIGDNRTEQNFAANTRWDDNLNIHLSKSVVRLVAQYCGLDKGKPGMLASTETREAFLRRETIASSSTSRPSGRATLTRDAAPS
jgi:hypothetical protein